MKKFKVRLSPRSGGESIEVVVDAPDAGTARLLVQSEYLGHKIDSVREL